MKKYPDMARILYLSPVIQFLRACVIFCYTHYLYLSMPLKTVWRNLLPIAAPQKRPAYFRDSLLIATTRHIN
ncbi:MAG: hypothetical protein BCS36_11565 [Desulfovibrio sp. MES5]|nr:MAG: hypothetical protein BCS36_11565 [Desulfovibrio sp. MES5]